MTQPHLSPLLTYIYTVVHLASCFFFVSMSRYEVDLTTTQADGPCTCDRCKQAFSAGTKLHYMQDRKHPNKPGRSVCDSCHDYYLSKPSTRHLEGTFCCLVFFWSF